MEKLKLNILQRGLPQKLLVAIAYVISFLITVSVVDFVDQKLFTETLKLAVANEIITQETFLKLQEYIDTRQSVVGIAVVIVGIACIILAYVTMRWSAKHNLSLPINLPCAMEFRPAMKNLGIMSLVEEIEFIRKHRINVFISLKPFIKEQEENIRVRLYPFARNDFLSVTSVFEKSIGARKLCISKEDYENLLEKSQETFSLKESSILSEKEKEIDGLTSSIASLKLELEKNQKELDELKKKHTALKNSQKPVIGQEVARVNRLRQEMLQWAVVLPTLEMLIEEAPINKIYVERELTERFNSEWSKREDLQEQMQALTKSKELKLSEAFMKSIKSYLAEKNLYSHKGGGQFKYPKKPI